MLEYRERMSDYRNARDQRMQELHDRLMKNYDLNRPQFNLLWQCAYEDCHSEGLQSVVQSFDNLYDLCMDFVNLQVSK